MQIYTNTETLFLEKRILNNFSESFSASFKDKKNEDGKIIKTAKETEEDTKLQLVESGNVSTKKYYESLQQKLLDGSLSLEEQQKTKKIIENLQKGFNNKNFEANKDIINERFSKLETFVESLPDDKQAIASNLIRASIKNEGGNNENVKILNIEDFDKNGIKGVDDFNKYENYLKSKIKLIIEQPQLTNKEVNMFL